MGIKRSTSFGNESNIVRDRCIREVAKSKAKIKYLVRIKVEDPTEEVIQEQIDYLKYNSYGTRITRVGMTEKDGLHILYFKCTGAKYPASYLADVKIEYADESSHEACIFYSELDRVLKHYVGKSYTLNGKFKDKLIKVLIDNKVLFILEHLPRVSNVYGVTPVGECSDNLLTGLLNVPCIVGVNRV